MAGNYWNGGRGSPAMGRVLVVLGLAAVLIVGFFVWRRQERLAAETAAWTVEGPACPRITAQAFEDHRPPGRQAFEYNGVLYTRFSGHVTCNNLDPGEASMRSVCQFSSPTVLKVQAGAQAAHFLLPPGQAATTEVRAGQVRCVLGASERF